MCQFPTANHQFLGCVKRHTYIYALQCAAVVQLGLSSIGGVPRHIGIFYVSINHGTPSISGYVKRRTYIDALQFGAVVQLGLSSICGVPRHVGIYATLAQTFVDSGLPSRPMCQFTTADHQFLGCVKRRTYIDALQCAAVAQLEPSSIGGFRGTLAFRQPWPKHL